MRRRFAYTASRAAAFFFQLRAAAIRFRDVGPQVERRQIHQHLITVVPLVGDDLVDHRGLHRPSPSATASSSSAAAVTVSAIVVVSP